MDLGSDLLQRLEGYRSLTDKGTRRDPQEKYPLTPSRPRDSEGKSQAQIWRPQAVLAPELEESARLYQASQQKAQRRLEQH